MTQKRSPLGVSDFKTIITDDRYFVDKSLFIKDVVLGNDVLLFPRPRRFGKTLNLSMLRYFYDCNADNSSIFEGLAISAETEIMQKQGKHPVIYLTFKDIKSANITDCNYLLSSVISQLYNQFDYLFDKDIYRDTEKTYFQSIASGKAHISEYTQSLQNLTEYIHRYHQIKPVLLLDEYDTPIHAAFYSNYYDDLIGFMRIFLGSALKDNNHLEKAVLTGILRVAKESMFSGLNNLTVCSILYDISADKFGFTQAEVEQALFDHDLADRVDEVRNMYNGYNIGDRTIYNPWSVLNYLYMKRLDTYWINTSDNKLVKDLCAKAGDNVKQELELLIEGGSVKKPIDDSIVFSELDDSEEALWSFLLMGGYLKYANYHFDQEREKGYADLTVPNKEISSMYRHQIIKKWINKSEVDKYDLEDIMTQLTTGKIEDFIASFTEYCQSSFSYYDVSGEEPERFYHAFVLGMLICLRDRYEIRSNRESGFGRYDVMLIPKTLPSHSLKGEQARGFIFEFKTLPKNKRDTLETAMIKAKRQIKEMNYAQELKSHGVSEIINIVAVFEGKDMRMEGFI